MAVTAVPKQVLRRSKFWVIAALAALVATAQVSAGNDPGAIATSYGLSAAKMFGINLSRTPRIHPVHPPLSVHWTYDGGAVMNPVAVKGVVYGGTVSTPYQVVALNVKNGKTLWAQTMNNQVMTMPLVVGDTVYVGTGNSLFAKVPVAGEENVRGTGASSLTALSTKTGRVLWQDNTSGENMPTPVYWHGDLYAVGGSDQLLEIDPASGKILRDLPIASYVSMSSPAVSHGMMYFGGAYPYDFHAVNLSSWRVQWSTHLPQTSGALDDCPPLVVGNSIYTETVQTSGTDNLFSVVELNRATGQILWQKALGSGPLPYSASGRASNESGIPTYHQGVIYLGSPITKTLYALNAKTGRILWSNGLQHQGITQAPIYIGGQLLVGDGGGTLWDINARTGQVLDHTTLGGAFMPSVPQIVGQTLLVGTRAPSLNALPLHRIAPGLPASAQ
jgi:outer membrane protein assembly factor BamB